MNPLNVIFVTVATAIAAVGVYLAFLPGITAVQTNSAVENIQVLSQILKTAELQGISQTNRSNADEMSHLLTGWTQGGLAINTGTTTPTLLDSVAGQNTIILNAIAPRGGYRIALQSIEVCEGVKRTLESRQNPVFGLGGCLLFSGGPTPYGAHVITAGGNPGGAPETRTIAIYLR